MEQNLLEKALMFAAIAHSGQTRKGEPDKPYIVHPIAVAQILMEYGADNNVIAISFELDNIAVNNEEFFSLLIKKLKIIATQKEKDDIR